MEIIEVQKCTEPEKFLEMIDDCIQSLQELREKVRQEIYYNDIS